MEEKRGAVPVSLFIKLQNGMDVRQRIRKSAMGLSCGFVSNFEWINSKEEELGRMENWIKINKYGI